MNVEPFTLLAVVLGALLVVGAIWLRWFDARGRSRRAVSPVEVPPPSVEVPQPSKSLVSCGTCKHWDLHVGQKMLQNTAFGQAAQVLQPFQMAAKREVTPNPVYLEVEIAMQRAAAEGRAEESLELSRQLELLDPGELAESAEPVPAELLHARWEDLGACGYHQELRFKVDRCGEYDYVPDVPHDRLVGRA